MGLPFSGTSCEETGATDGAAAVVVAIVADGAFGASANGVVGVIALNVKIRAYKYLVGDTRGQEAHESYFANTIIIGCSSRKRYVYSSGGVA